MQKLQHRISKKLVTILFILLALPISVFLVQQARGVQGSTFSLRYTIYEDALASGWHARSRASRINLANPSPVYSGSKSISFTPTGRGALLYLYTNTAIDITSYSSLHFAAQASRAGQDYTVTLYDGANKPLSTLRLARYGGDPVPGSWKVYNIPLSDLRAKATHINGVAIQSRSHRFATLYLDSMSLTGTVSSPTPTPTPTSTPTPTPTATSTPTPTPTPSATPGPTVSIKTVFMIVMENNDWSTIRGNSSAPYINNTLLPQASFATQYFNPPGNHPSEPNYLWLEAGTNFGVSNDNPPSDNHQNTTAHLVTQLQNAGLSWKAYEESIDGNACPLVDSYPYATRHNPMIFFDDVTGTNNPKSAYCIAHERPYGELASDLQNNTVANYNFITPNLCDDMHDSCSPTNDGIKQGDTWLSHEVPTILNSQAYKNGGVLFITWDEGENGSDGPIGMIVLSPYAKGNGYNNSIHYTHSSTLKTIQEIFQVTPLLGDAANATDLGDLFQPGVLNPPNSSGQGQSSKLTWAPPQLTNPETLNLTTNPQGLDLDKTKDYILKFPSTPIVAQFNDYAVLNITGGHNIVMIGGEIHIPDLPDTQNGVQGNDNQRQAMRLDGNTGTVFIEGLEVSGTCMDFMDISAPQARVILQNVRVEGCRSHDESLSDGYTDEHPDLIQPWGGAKEIDIDGFTGFSDYQGFQLNSDLEVVGNIVVKHANIGRIATVPQYGRYFMWQDCNSSKFRDCATNADAPDFPHWDLTDDSFYIQPADNRSLDDSVWPAANGSDPRKAVLAADGQSVSWPNYTEKMNGRVRLGPPPGGDFVPAGSVGIGYVSPGYLNGVTSSLSPSLTQAPLIQSSSPTIQTIFRSFSQRDHRFSHNAALRELGLVSW